MFYKDLSDYTYYLKQPLSTVKNVGWIEKGKPYRTGSVSDDFLPKLSKIILGNDVVNAQVNKMRSAHPCALSNCEIIDSCDKRLNDSLGAAEIWIPSEKSGSFFAAPSMVYHYVKKHSYLPPKVFIDSVMQFDLSVPYKAQKIYLKQIKDCI